MTASEASRNFSAVLDKAEAGETIIITRGGKRLAVIGPAPAANGKAIKEVLADYTPSHSDDLEREITATRDLLTLNDPWNE
jgi:prevent-host-death family protein